jgi:hypothetical protein
MSRQYIGVIFLCILFFLVFAFAFAFTDRSPLLIIGGEDSVGSWMSGTLLIISSTTTAIIASKRGWFPWIIFSLFFFLLAIDENFMIHEAIKRQIVFVRYEASGDPVYWIGELPVIIAACIGAVVAWVMWKNVDRQVRWLIITGVFFGAISVTMDVVAFGVLWEDSCKLIGELAVASALVWNVQKQ